MVDGDSGSEPDGRKYRRPSNLLTFSGGMFEYLPMSGDFKEAAAKGLMTLMCGISERRLGAGWHNDLEYMLWMARETGATRMLPEITHRECLLLRLLSEECGGWWMYPLDDDGDAALEFVSLEKWQPFSKLGPHALRPGGPSISRADTKRPPMEQASISITDPGAASLCMITTAVA